MISKRNAPNAPTHSVYSEELQLYKKISVELAVRCKHVFGMDSESTKMFCPFFMAAQVGGTDVIPTDITSEMVRAKFVGTIFLARHHRCRTFRTQTFVVEESSEDGEDEKEYL